ncbi:MAG: glutamyl-tRNA reductase [Opitutales bacterium]|nr:glutamyl-tRNA reductase [Opitutales bacterium]
MKQEEHITFLVVGATVHSTEGMLHQTLLLEEEQLHALSSSLDRDPNVSGHLILKTCNRIEVYCSRSGLHAGEKILQQFYELLQIEENLVYVHINENATRHLMRVCSGLDSEIIGETEILGQVKCAYETSTRANKLTPLLHRIFQKSLQAAKWIRTNTQIGYGHVSLGNIAVELAMRIHGNLNRKRILLIGAGQVGKDVAIALHSRGAPHINVANRTQKKADELALLINGTSISFDTWQEHLDASDIVICSTSSTTEILNQDAVARIIGKRPSRPLFLIDLGMPHNICGTAGDLESVYLYTLKDITEIANRNLEQRKSELALAESTLEKKAQRVWREIEARNSNNKIYPTLSTQEC